MQQPLKRRASAAYTVPYCDTQEYPPLPSLPPPRKKPVKRYVVFGALVVLISWFTFTTTIRPFIDSIEQQWHYGDTPVYQLDADVGHGGVSHFLAFTLQGKILVIEVFPNYQVKVYPVGSFFTAVDRQPVIQLAVADMNNDGKPDLLVHVAGQSASVVLLNTGEGFVIQGS